MKLHKITLLIICLLLPTLLSAQQKGISFQSTGLEQAMQEAKRSGKLIFLDCYTSWCGPCKMLARTTFLNDTVGDFFNRNFISLKMDMEKGDGPDIAKRYHVSAYPTLLFINSDGRLRHSAVGFQSVSELLQEARTALQGNETLPAYVDRYEKGERSESFMRAFLRKLYKGGRSDLQPKVATELINTFNDRQFYTRDCWNLIVYHISDPMSPILQKVVANRYKFEHIIARDTIDLFLNYAFNSKANSYLWMEANSPRFDLDKFNAYVGYLKSINYARSPIYLATLYAARKRVEGDYAGMTEEMRKAFHYNIFQGDDKVQFVHACMIQISKSGNEALIRQCVGWMQQLASQESSGYYKSEYMKAEATLLKALGKTDEAEALTAKARRTRMQ